MTDHDIPDWLVSLTWLGIILWCVAASVAIVIGLAWLLALAAQWLVFIGSMVLG
jgi:hypothetical protein